MKKRIARKISRRKNRQRILIGLKPVFDKYQISDDYYWGTGYFVMSLGESSTYEFSLKRFPDVKFGVWLREGGLELFAEHKAFIDKFKPSSVSFNFHDASEILNEIGLWEKDYLGRMIEVYKYDDSKMFDYNTKMYIPNPSEKSFSDYVTEELNRVNGFTKEKYSEIYHGTVSYLRNMLKIDYRIENILYTSDTPYFHEVLQVIVKFYHGTKSEETDKINASIYETLRDKYWSSLMFSYIDDMTDKTKFNNKNYIKIERDASKRKRRI